MEPFYRNEYRNQLEDLFIEKELDGMDDKKALELLLLFTLPIHEAGDVANNLISHFGSFREVINADYEKLIEVGGTDKDTAVLIALVKDLYTRSQAAPKNDVNALDSSQRCVSFFTPYLRFKKEKTVYAAALDSSFRVIKLAEISQGDTRFDESCAEKAAEFAKITGAASLIAGYNADDEELFPDGQITAFVKTLNEKLEEANAELNDVAVIGKSRALAFSDDLRLAVYLCK